MAEGLVREIDARSNNRSKFLAAAAELALKQRTKTVAAVTLRRKAVRKAPKRSARRA
jgi:hypothetical protein